MSLAALRIQSIWRGQQDRKRVKQLRWEMAVAKERLDALIKIQTWTRSRLERLRFVRLRQATFLAQRLYKKRHLKRVAAVIVLQSYCRTWLAKRRLHKIQSAAITLQSIWRGRKVRVSVKSKKIARARDRCMKACKAATEDKKLCNRTTSGLHFLLTYKHLHQVVEAVCSLEVATRLSARCCERLVAGKAVPVLFRLIKNCNRSLPCMEVIKYVVATLVNLAKYAPTAPSVLECPDAVSSILDLMMIYRETNPVIFTKAAMLLTVLAQEESLQKILLGTSKINDKLRSLLNLQERKLKLKTRQMIAKSKSQGMSMTPSQLMTPSKKKRLVQSFQPDWVLGRFKRQDLEDPIEALKCLMGALNIKF